MSRVNTRYIHCGIVDENDPISKYKLIYGYKGWSSLVWKVNIPDDMKLIRGGDGYSSTTSDNRTLKEVGYSIIVDAEYKGKWEKIDDDKLLQEILSCFRNDKDSIRCTDPANWEEIIIKKWRDIKRKKRLKKKK